MEAVGRTKGMSLTRRAILQSEIEENRWSEPVDAYLSGLAPGSRRAMRQVLSVIARELGGELQTVPWHNLEYRDTQAVRAQLMAAYAAATANRALSALRGVLREAFRLGWMDAESFHRAGDLRPVRGVRVLRGRALTMEEIAALFEVCDSESKQGVRDAAVLALCFGAGLRREEAVMLKVTDYDAASASVVAVGKGNKQRRVFVNTQMAAVIANWVRARGPGDGTMLLAINKADRIEHRRLSAEAIAVVLTRLANRAGIPALTPHDLRRTFVSELLTRGADLATVQLLAGHSNPATTVRYDRRGEEVQRRAVELLHIANDVDLPFASRRAMSAERSRRQQSTLSRTAR